MALRQMGFDLKIFHSYLRFSACVKEAKGETSLILSSVSFLGGYFTVNSNSLKLLKRQKVVSLIHM